MTDIENAAWLSFGNVVKNFLGKNKADNYKEIVAELIENYKNLGCNMSLKLHFLDSHLDKFPENLSDYSEEQEERFHQDMSEMEERYQGVWNEHMMSDYCWSMKRDCKTSYKRQAVRRSFESKVKRYYKKNE